MLAYAKRQRAVKEIDRRRRDLKTYTDPLDESREDLHDFLDDFDSDILSKKQVEMQQIFLEHPVVQGFYRELVPNVVEHDDFWQRYYYRTSSTDRVLLDLDVQDVAKLKSRSESVKMSWSEITTPSNSNGVLTQYATDLDALRKLSPKTSTSTRTTVGSIRTAAGAENVENAPSQQQQQSHSRGGGVHKSQRKGGLFDRTSMQTEDKEETTNLLLKWSRSLTNISLSMDQNESKEMESTDAPDTEPTTTTEVGPPVVSLEKLSTHRTEDDTPILAEEFFAEDDDVVETSVQMDSTGAASVPPKSRSSSAGVTMWWLLFALLGIGCAAAFVEIQTHHPHLLVAVQNSVCGPVAPWTKLSATTRSLQAQAPWFAPRWSSEAAFVAVCGTRRPRTSLQWQETARKGVYSLTVSNVSNNKKKRWISKSGLRSVEFPPNTTVVWNDGRKTGTLSAPWKL